MTTRVSLRTIISLDVADACFRAWVDTGESLSGGVLDAARTFGETLFEHVPAAGTPSIVLRDGRVYAVNTRSPGQPGPVIAVYIGDVDGEVFTARPPRGR